MLMPSVTIEQIREDIESNAAFLTYDFYTPIGVDCASWYAVRVLSHIEAVKHAGAMLGLPPHQIDKHDRSKLGNDEFAPYARYFWHAKNYPNSPNPHKQAFNRAWLLHQNRNPHHWQHWIMPVKNEVFEMPEEYAAEMVADWMGAGLIYSGSWDMTDWVKSNLPKITLHDNTRRFVTQLLKSIGVDV